jgi:hypothetical protein
MTRHAAKAIEAHRHEFVHGDDADFIVYQRRSGHGRWRTIASWMIPRTGN